LPQQRIASIRQIIAKEPDRRNEIGLPASALANQHRKRIEIHAHIAKAFVILNLNAFDHTGGLCWLPRTIIGTNSENY
jgi:hypothetical protein